MADSTCGLSHCGMPCGGACHSAHGDTAGATLDTDVAAARVTGGSCATSSDAITLQMAR
jgi:hypothetical protein